MALRRRSSSLRVSPQGWRRGAGRNRDPAAGQELLALLDESFEVAKLLLLAEAHQGDSPIQDELRYRSRLHSLLIRGDCVGGAGIDRSFVTLNSSSAERFAR